LVDSIPTFRRVTDTLELWATLTFHNVFFTLVLNMVVVESDSLFSWAAVGFFVRLPGNGTFLLIADTRLAAAFLGWIRFLKSFPRFASWVFPVKWTFVWSASLLWAALVFIISSKSDG
jgi:hypothetical protein